MNTLSQTKVSAQSDFTMKVMNYVAVAFAVTAAGAYFAPAILPASFLAGGGYWIIFIAELALIFTSGWWSQMAPPVNYFLFGLFAFLSGLTLYPLLMLALSVGGSEMIFKALTATVALSFAAGTYAKTTQRDLSGMGGFLMMGLIGLIVVGVLQIFWFNSMVELISSGIGVILFSAFIAYDIQMIEKYPHDRAIEASIGLYLSIFNLFVSLLRFLIAMKSSD
ncbi:Bax inhibitor-1/YccA family protein [Candidatus Peregrinibacteria bacterium]|jgi:modulator of FtsH protease|nr:Bax inhibitor-1/YccA family protein [Candidatus Peregrinibacteria bacterium]